MCYCPTPTLHLSLALTGDGAFLLSLKKTYSVWFISVLNYGDTENVLINHLLLVIPMSYPCHYTNLCLHKPHKHAHTHTHTRTHTHTLVFMVYSIGRYFFLSVFKVLLLNISKTYSDSDCWETNLRVSPFKKDHAYNSNGPRTACNLLCTFGMQFFRRFRLILQESKRYIYYI